ncbi:hypothetical protein D9M68_935370 [compost metagenome]
MLGLFDIGDDATFDAGRRTVAKANDIGLMGTAAQRPAFGTWRQTRNDAAHLGRTDIKHRNQRGLAGLNGAKPGSHGIGHHCCVVAWPRVTEGSSRGGIG